MEHPYPLPRPLPGRLVLASGSPRRRELLGSLGIPFDVVAPDVAEGPRPRESPAELGVRLAQDKALAVARDRPDGIVLGADTVVALDGEILGKPGTDDEAQRMLRLLSGREHDVHTAVALVSEGAVAFCLHERSRVTFEPLGDAVVDWYVATGEPHDKAGAYAIQGIGAALVARVDGSVSSVIGLPVAAVASALTRWLAT